MWQSFRGLKPWKGYRIISNFFIIFFKIISTNQCKRIKIILPLKAEREVSSRSSFRKIDDDKKTLSFINSNFQGWKIPERFLDTCISNWNGWKQ